MTDSSKRIERKTPSAFMLPNLLHSVPTHLTELEARLASADGAVLKDKLLAELTCLEQRLRQQIANSLSRADYVDYLAAAEAAHAAIEVLRSWPVATSIQISATFHP